MRDRDLMHELYVNQKMSTTEIAKIFDSTPSTVLNCLKQCGIKTRTKSESIKGKPRPGSQGEKHRDWKGGITELRKLARGRLNSIFVRPILERDGFRCVWCEDSKNLVVHHHNRTFKEIVDKIRENLSEENKLEFVDAVVNEHRLDDGITLCKKCHDEYHRKNGK